MNEIVYYVKWYTYKSSCRIHFTLLMSVLIKDSLLKAFKIIIGIKR